MSVAQQVETAIHHILSEASPAAAVSDTAAARAERLTYALGWIVANIIVSARYRESAIDALPVFHPQSGWDRFLLTRRVSCQWCKDEPADAFGLIMLDGDDSPRLTYPNGKTRLSLGRLLRTDSYQAVERVLELFPPIGLVAGDHTPCWHERAVIYPTLYAAVTDLILEYPTLTAAREVLIDDQQIDGVFHPLYAHIAARSAHLAYDWFELKTDDFLTYFRIHGEQAIYLTDKGWWSTVTKPLAAEEQGTMKHRILAWLRLRGNPDPAVD